jgi:hypothetical protein
VNNPRLWTFFRALLPELLTFAYIPANHLKFDGNSRQPDPTQYNEDEHVLVLEMDDRMVRKKRPPTDPQVSLGIGLVSKLMLLIYLSMPLVPEPLNAVCVKLLIEKRNAIFSKAVDEYGIYRLFLSLWVS